MKTTRLKREAIRWLVQIKTADSINEKSWAEFEEWLQPPAHRVMYLRLERTWYRLERAARLAFRLHGSQRRNK